jgi:hypothetical protein
MHRDLSIIIVSYNTRNLLQECLRSIFQETKGLEFEVIVVDNASTDGSREMLEQEFPQVKRIYNSENKGFAAANNQGITKADGEYVLLLNSDTKILDGAVFKTVEFMKQRPEANIVGCKLLNADGTLQPSCRSFPSVWNLFSESLFLYKLFKRTQLFGKYHMSYFDYDSIHEVDVVMGAFMMIRREVFEKVGLFDESYFMYTEETEFCYRAKKQGYKVLFTPLACVFHYGGGSIRNEQSYFEQIHQSQLQFIRANFHGLQKHAGVFLKQLGIAIRVPAYFLLGLLTLNPGLLQKSRFYSSVLVKTFR